MYSIQDIDWLGKSILHREYNLLYSFFQTAWESRYEYIVMMPRRCFNLNHVFERVQAGCGLSGANQKQIISNSALLLYSKSIARHYMTHRRFPRILILDDLIFHGRTLTLLLRSLEKLILANLEEMAGPQSPDQRYYIRRSLVSAIDISVFAAGKQPLLMDKAYLQKLHISNFLGARELRSLSQRISSFLQRAEASSSNYALSYDVTDLFNCVETSDWRSRVWHYRGIEQKAFFDCGPEEGSNLEQIHYLPIVRLNQALAEQAGCSGDTWLTGLVLFGSLSTKCLDDICIAVWAELEKMNIPQGAELSAILHARHPLLQKQRLQFISFLLSVISIYDYCEAILGTALVFNPAQSNLKKIASNFAHADEIEAALTALCMTPQIWKSLRNVLYPAFQKNAQPLFQKEPLRGGTFLALDPVTETAEYCLFRVGMESERCAYRASHGLERVSLNANRISLQDYFAETVTPNTSRLDQILCMLTLMDSGLVSLNIGTNRDENDWSDDAMMPQYLLKTGELALFSVFRWIHLFIPALVHVEQKIWPGGKVQPALKRFICTLPDEIEAEGEMTPALQKEQRALRWFKQAGSDFVDMLYSCGHSFYSWNIDLVTVDDWRESDSGDYLSFVRYQAARQEVYLEKAKTFTENASGNAE